MCVNRFVFRSQLQLISLRKSRADLLAFCECVAVAIWQRRCGIACEFSTLKNRVRRRVTEQREFIETWYTFSRTGPMRRVICKQPRDTGVLYHIVA